jgi:hypothetical protein
MSKKSKDLDQAVEPERRTVRGVSRETERRTGEVAPVPVGESSQPVSSSQGTMPSNTVTQYPITAIIQNTSSF